MNAERVPPPDFVLAGAPRCGTTSVYRFLSGHPQVFMPDCKEPHWFAFDYPNRKKLSNIRNVGKYEKLFSGASPNQIRGEASVLYLSSRSAIPAMRNRNPDLKVIAIVRDPIAMFLSWHQHCVRVLEEDEPDPEKAWRLQSERAAGDKIPRTCTEPAFLQYREFCSLGRQIERLNASIPERHRLVLHFDTLVSSPGNFYGNLCRFLDIDSVETAEFPNENPNAANRSILLAIMLRGANRNAFAGALRPLVRRLGISPLQRLAAWNTTSAPARPLNANFAEELRSDFDFDTKLIEAIGDSWQRQDPFRRKLKL